MALGQDCNASRVEYLGNGVQKDFTITFEYFERADIGVANWNAVNLAWDLVASTEWFFLNDTEIRFNTAPVNGLRFIIYRNTDIDQLPADFTPGSAIKAKDLNDNFDVLKWAIEEARCSEQVGSGSAITDTIKEKQQTDGDVVTQNLVDDTTVFTSAASVARHDNIVGDKKPAVVPVEQSGKIWNDTDELVDYFWDPDGKVWVSFTKSGPAGQPGDYGPPGKVITSDSPPTQYPAVGTNTARPLENGDLWFDTYRVLLYLYYKDNNSSQWISISKAGPPGQNGVGSNLSWGNNTSTTGDVVNDAGTSATLTAATTTQAGLMSGADKQRVDTSVKEDFTQYPLLP